VAIHLEPFDVRLVLALEPRDRLLDRLGGARVRLQLAAQARELLLGGRLGRLRRGGGVLESADLGFELQDARGGRLVGDEIGRFDPALSPIGQSHVRVARIALEHLEGRAADEVLDRLVAGVGRVVQAEPQDVRDVNGFGADATGPQAEREA